MATLNACLNISELRALARRALPLPIFDMLEGGAEDEKTLARNRLVFDNWVLLQRSFVNVAEVRAGTRVLGGHLDWPFLVSPTGMLSLLHPEGEAAVARAAERTGAMYCLSTMSSQSIEAVAAATKGAKAFQLYLFRDRGVSRELIQRARSAGYQALILTVDSPLPSNRERDKRSGLTLPPSFGLRSLAALATRPRWCWGQVRHPLRMANIEKHIVAPGMTGLRYIGEQLDPTVSWQDLEWVAKEWNGPLAVKGILSADDAAHAVGSGATCIMLSNHGGRQLDAVATPMDVLEETAERLAGSGEIVVDGGIRRGTDMLKAIALGARACMSGRVGLYGLAAGGVAGAERALSLLRNEFVRDLALMGVPDIANLNRHSVKRIRHQ